MSFISLLLSPTLAKKLCSLDSTSNSMSHLFLLLHAPATALVQDPNTQPLQSLPRCHFAEPLSHGTSPAHGFLLPTEPSIDGGGREAHKYNVPWRYWSCPNLQPRWLKIYRMSLERMMGVEIALYFLQNHVVLIIKSTNDERDIWLTAEGCFS